MRHVLLVLLVLLVPTLSGCRVLSGLLPSGSFSPTTAASAASPTSLTPTPSGSTSQPDGQDTAGDAGDPAATLPGGDGSSIADPPEGRGSESDREAEGRGEAEGGDEYEPLDLSIEVVDRHGRAARVRLGVYGPVRRPLETYVMRRRDQERERFQEHWELIQQTYTIPLSDFLAVEPALDPATLREIRFVFDRSAAGEVAIDRVGLTRLEPEFLNARVEVESRISGP